MLEQRPLDANVDVAPFGSSFQGHAAAHTDDRRRGDRDISRSGWRFDHQPARVTQGQLDAVAMRCRAVLDDSLQRVGSAAVATLAENVLVLRVEHSLAAAEHQLMRRASGRQFFQHYVEELAEQIYPDFTHHIENLLPVAVTHNRVKVDCEGDCLVFTFGLRPRWD